MSTPPKSAGRPKGSKNKLPRGLVEKVLHIAEKLEREGKGLEDCARQDPGWFYKHFVVPLLPKNVEVTGADGGPIQTAVEVRFVKNGHS